MDAPSNFDALFGGNAASPSPSAKGPAVDKRREPRVKVKWPARVLLADGRMVDVRVEDVSESGVALVSGRGLPTDALLRVALGVPGIDRPGQVTTVTGSVRTAHVTVRGPDLVYGGMWVELDPKGRELLRAWIRKLK